MVRLSYNNPYRSRFASATFGGQKTENWKSQATAFAVRLREHCTANCAGRDMRAWLNILVVGLTLSTVGGCRTHIVLRKNTIQTASTIADLNDQQVLDNVARFETAPSTLPSLAIINAEIPTDDTRDLTMPRSVFPRIHRSSPLSPKQIRKRPGVSNLMSPRPGGP